VTPDEPRPPLFRRLIVRIYLFGLVQYLVVVAGVAMLVRQSRVPESYLRRQAVYVVAQLHPLLGNRPKLQTALEQARTTAGVNLSLWRSDGTLIASNVDPPLAAPQPGPEGMSGPAHTVVVPLFGIQWAWGDGSHPLQPPRALFHLRSPGVPWAPPAHPESLVVVNPPTPMALLPTLQTDGPVAAGASVFGTGFVVSLSPPGDVPGAPQTSGVFTAGTFPGPGMAAPVPPLPHPEGWAVLDLRPPVPPLDRLALIVGLVLATVGVSSALLARSVSGPLRKLSSAAVRLGAGDLDARARLERSDELGAVGRAFDGMADRIVALLRSEKALLAGVSHELRTPLARIRVALDLAAEGDVATARASLADITDDLGELERLVDELLTAARLELGQRSASPVLQRMEVACRDLVDAAADRFRTLHPDRLLETKGVEMGGRLSADPVLIGRVLNNLLDNAAKYSERRMGLVRLSVEGLESSVVFTVEDHGIGIAPEDLPHVFTPFFRSDRSRSRATGGFGLGLSLARTIAQAHGGSLSVSSRLGSGTAARLVLPRFAPPGPALHRATQAQNTGESLDA
jgi:two-component system, OmpR family, sensor kinase